MAPSVLKDYRRIQGSRFDSYLDHPVTVVKGTDGLIHGLRGCTSGLSPHRRVSSQVTTTYRLLLKQASVVCLRCSEESVWSGTPADGYLVLAGRLLVFERRLERITAATDTALPGVVRRHLRELDDLVYHHQPQVPSADPYLVALYDAQAELVERAAPLRAALIAAVRRASVEVFEGVRSYLTPERYRSTGLLFDLTPTLVGISPTPSSFRVLVDSVVATASIRTGDDVVLVVPAFVASFLVHSLVSSNSQYLVTCAPAPDDPAVLETAAGIWDPTDGDLVSMVSAVCSARAL